MSVFKCKMCGASLNIPDGVTTSECEYCGTKQTLPRLDDDRRVNLYDRANHFRRNNDFDKAAGIYEQILSEDSNDAEAYWSLVLCRYGIEYVEDPATHRRVPTVNRTQFTSVFDDDNYKSALEHADSYQCTIYEDEAKTINEIQKGILDISQKEEPFDVFICYKETDNNGQRTPDSVLANDLYHQLTQEGFKVFFSRITLEDKLGTAYEPYIFAALNSAKVMVVLGTKPEYFNAVWVKNEWSRYLSIVAQSNGKKALIPAYKDMDPYDLPEQFSHLQAQDMSKLGFMQDLIRGISKIVKANESTNITLDGKDAVSTGGVVNTEPLLKRVFIFLEDENWEEADAYCEKVLDQEPENARAYLGKLLSTLHLHRMEELASCEHPFDDNKDYQKAIRFGDESLSQALRVYIDKINERKHYTQFLSIYDQAVSEMINASSSMHYRTAEMLFKKIHGFKDADILAEQCSVKMEECKKIEKRKAIAVVTAMKEFLEGNTEPTLEERLFASKSKIESLVATRDRFDDLTKQAIRLKQEQEELSSRGTSISAQIKDLESQEAILSARGEKLGIFAGKEKKKISEELYAIDYRKENLSNDYDMIVTRNQEIMNLISKNDQQRSGYSTKEEIEEKIDKERAIVSDLEKQIDNKQKNSDFEYNYRDAIKVYCNEPGVSREVDVLYPEAKFIIGACGASKSIEFGSYYQTNDEALEPIEWVVLSNNNESMLLISRYILDCQKFNKELENNVWETSDLRKWLNSTFFEVAFTKEEQKMLLEVPVSEHQEEAVYGLNDNNALDRVFLLSESEAAHFLTSTSNELGKCVATDYALKHAVNKSLVGMDKNACSWWLRSPGRGYGEIYVSGSGEIEPSGCSSAESDYLDCGVRPAVLIDLRKLNMPSMRDMDNRREVPFLNERDLFKFGSYNRKKDKPIEWVVLKERGNRILLISKYATYKRAYNMDDNHISWEDSSLRSWLNGGFLVSSFSPEEQSLIVDMDSNSDHIDNNTSANKDTNKLFLLSIDEVCRYFPTDIDRCATDNDGKRVSWWLRTSKCSNYAPYVSGDGSVAENGAKVDNDYYAVRPAMWIYTGFNG